LIVLEKPISGAWSKPEADIDRGRSGAFTDLGGRMHTTYHHYGVIDYINAIEKSEETPRELLEKPYRRANNKTPEEAELIRSLAPRSLPRLRKSRGQDHD